MRPVTVSVGPNASSNATSATVRFDDWAPSYISIQIDVSGTVNYTVQSSLDDPNSPANPVAVNSMTWVNSSDTAAVGATGNLQTNFLFAPAFARILLNSGTGTVTATFLQSGSS